MVHFHEFLMLITGLLVSLIATPLGCLVVWRRMAYFGDALSHTALLGVALGFLLGSNTYLGVGLVCGLFAVLLVWMENRYKLPMDTLLGILAHGGLALGILSLSFFNLSNETPQPAHNEPAHVNLHEFERYFFGDLSHTSGQTIILIGLSAVFILGLLYKNWAYLILAILSEDLAKAEGHNTLKLKYILLSTLTLTVALAIHTVGVLFTTSLLLLPAAIARQWARNPRNMVIYAYGAALVSQLISFPVSLNTQQPFGPVLIAVLYGFFIISLISSGVFGKKPPHI